MARGQKPLAVLLEEFTHGENREQELALVKHIDVEGCEFQLVYHGDVEGVGRCAVLGGIPGRLGLFPRILFVTLQKFRM